MESFEKYKKHVEESFRGAENNCSKITQEIKEMEGMSGIMTRHFYNNLLNIEDARYLEIGTWKGSSVCAAMCENNAKVVCIDNWSEFGGPKEEFLLNFNKFKGDNDACFVEGDCYQLDLSNFPKFNMYMYDGNHTVESHFKSLHYYYDFLDDVFIYIVDDWNGKEVREGTEKAIKDLDFTILYERNIRLTWDNSHTDYPLATSTWWNGIYVAILKKNNYGGHVHF